MIGDIRTNIERQVEEEITASIEAQEGKNNSIRRWYNKTELTNDQIAKAIVRIYAQGVVIKQKWNDETTETTSKFVTVAIKLGNVLDEDASLKKRVRLGAWAADIMIDLNNVSIEMKKQDGKTVYYVAKGSNLEFNQLSRKIMLAYPDHYTYGRWVAPYNKELPIVKKMYKEDAINYTMEEIPMIYKGLNALGDTEWKINKFVFDVASSGIEGFTPEFVSDTDASKAHKSLPEKKRRAAGIADWIVKQRIEDQPDLSNNPKLLAYITRQAKEVADGKYKEMSSEAVSTISSHAKWTRFVDTMEYVSEVVDNKLKFCHNMDSRGRVYTIEHGISPQGSDVEKALLQFNVGVQWNENVSRKFSYSHS